jgi:hypothetical protein
LDKWEDIYTCPIINFQKAEETGDSRYLYKEYDEKKENLDEHFQKLTGEIIDEFGLSEIGQLIFFKNKELTKLRGKWIVTENDALLTNIRIAEIQLNILEKRVKRAEQGVETDIKKLHATNHRILSKWSGRDSRKLTVFEYYNDFRDFNNESIKDARPDKQRHTTRS